VQLKKRITITHLYFSYFNFFSATLVYYYLTTFTCKGLVGNVLLPLCQEPLFINHSQIPERASYEEAGTPTVLFRTSAGMLSCVELLYLTTAVCLRIRVLSECDENVLHTFEKFSVCI